MLRLYDDEGFVCWIRLEATTVMPAPGWLGQQEPQASFVTASAAPRSLWR